MVELHQMERLLREWCRLPRPLAGRDALAPFSLMELYIERQIAKPPPPSGPAGKLRLRSHCRQRSPLRTAVCLPSAMMTARQPPLGPEPAPTPAERAPHFA